MELVEEAWGFILEDYVESDDLDPETLAQGAIRGMLEAIGDPYTAHIDATLYRLDKSAFHGSFEGIGAVVTMEEEGLTIVAPIAGSPAERAGLRSGDRILEVDGEPTQGMSLVEAVLKIRGREGTTVTLAVLHEGEEMPLSMEIVRAEIKTESVSWEPLGDGIARVRVTYFSGRTNEELISALRELRGEGARAIVFDLRDNPGGYLEAAVDVASQFLSDGVVMYSVDSEGKRQTYEVRGGGVATDLPLVVLVSSHSASASEIVAGALQDHTRGPIIGERTAGKGSINHYRELSDGSALYITVGRWLTPLGRQIEGEGLVPDFEVAGAEAQLQRGIDYLKEKL